MTEKKNALISVYDKEGIAEFAQELVDMGWKIFSSGGTAKVLLEAGIPVTDVAELTGLSPILDHRVATLAPQLHGGLLATEKHLEELERLGFPWIDLVCAGFYPLEEETRRLDATEESVIEKTDIGGPTLCRSGAKGRRIVIIDPADRMRVIEWLKNDEPDGVEFRNDLAAKAEFIIAGYCLTSARFHSDGNYEGMIGTKITPCKYGENAWQTPADLFETDPSDPLAIARFRVLEGQPPGCNNYADIDRLLQAMTHIAEAFAINQDSPYIAVGVKHGNPCGAAVGYDPKKVIGDMMAGDPLAIFGGLVMTNFTINETLCGPLVGRMLDGIIAPDFTPGAIETLRRKEDKCRFVANSALENLVGHLDVTPRLRFVRGGFLMQPNYTFVLDLNSDQVAKYSQATLEQEADMQLAWAIGSTSNSNTITLVKDGQLIGNGVGQQDRIGAADLAIERALRSGHDVTGAVAYSDSFFPFNDAVEYLIDAGVVAILTSSGSRNDPKVIELCQERGIVLYMIPDAVGRGFFGH